MRIRGWKTYFLAAALGLAVGFGAPYLPTLVGTLLVWVLIGAVLARAVVFAGRRWWRRRRMEWGSRKWLFAAGALLFVASGGLAGYQPTKSAGTHLVWASFGFLVLAFLIPVVIRVIHAPPGTKVVFVLAAAFLCALPQILVSLATNGSASLTLRAFEDTVGIDSTGWISWVEAALLILVPTLLIGVPDILRYQVMVSHPGEREARDEGGAARIKRLVPGWIAASAALVTGIYAFVLHFASGPLARLSLQQLTVAVILAAVFLVPPYRLIARAVWNRGIAEAFNPGRWRADWHTLKSEVRETFYRRYVPALHIRGFPGAAPQPDPAPRPGKPR